jgi:hypothetical protein
MTRALRSVSLCLALTLIAPTARAADATLETIRQQAQACADAMLKGEFARFVDLTHPKLVELMGGRDKMIESLKKGTAQMKAQHTTIVAFNVAAPAGVIQNGKDGQLAIVPTNFELKAGKTKITQAGYLLGCSTDAGKTWTFIDGAGVTDAASLKPILGDVPKDLKLPERQQAVVDNPEKKK